MLVLTAALLGADTCPVFVNICNICSVMPVRVPARPKAKTLIRTVDGEEICVTATMAQVRAAMKNWTSWLEVKSDK